MTEPERPACATCAYWHPLPKFMGHDGECRRRAGRWPKRHTNDWCGEHPEFPAYLAALRAAKA